MFTLKDLQDKVEKGISNYIGFDVKEIFNKSDYITIYGGSVRDSIAGMDIHDIDILCMSTSAQKLREFIVNEKNYQPLDLYDVDTLNMYKGISIIEEPWTFMNDDKKIIQIIRPRYNGYPTIKKNDPGHTSGYKLAYYNLIKNVDLSCCGVFLENLDGNIKLREGCKSAIVHCLTKTFKIQEWSKLYEKNRTMNREYKLTSRGWENLSDPLNIYINKNLNLKNERRLKLIELEFKPEYDFKIWTEEDYLERVTKADENNSDVFLEVLIK
jgi:hypothetical protein